MHGTETSRPDPLLAAPGKRRAYSHPFLLSLSPPPFSSRSAGGFGPAALTHIRASAEPTLRPRRPVQERSALTCGFFASVTVPRLRGAQGVPGSRIDQVNMPMPLATIVRDVGVPSTFMVISGLGGRDVTSGSSDRADFGCCRCKSRFQRQQ